MPPVFFVVSPVEFEHFVYINPYYIFLDIPPSYFWYNKMLVFASSLAIESIFAPLFFSSPFGMFIVPKLYVFQLVVLGSSFIRFWNIGIDINK